MQRRAWRQSAYRCDLRKTLRVAGWRVLAAIGCRLSGIFFLLFHHTDKRGEQYECNMAAKNDFGIRFAYRSLVHCKREETPEGALHAEELR